MDLITILLAAFTLSDPKITKNTDCIFCAFGICLVKAVRKILVKFKKIPNRSAGKVNVASVAFLCRVVAREVVWINLFNAFVITRLSGLEIIATFVRTFDPYDR